MPRIPEFLIIPLLTVFISAVSLSLVSVPVVLKRWSFLAVGISHGAFFGVAVGLLLGLPPFIFGVISGFLLVTLVSLVSKGTNVDEDTVIGFLFPFFMALGVIAFSLGGVSYVDAFSYLFGGIFAIDEGYLLWAIVTFLITLVFLVTSWRNLFLWIINEEMSVSFGINRLFIYTTLLLITTFNIVLSMKTLGAILVSAFMVLPGFFAVTFFNSIFMFFLGSLFFTISVFTVGISMAFILDLPPGPIITVIGVFVLLLSLWGNKFFRRGG